VSQEQPPRIRRDALDAPLELTVVVVDEERRQPAYGPDVERVQASARKPLGKVTPEDLQHFADSLSGLAGASQKRTLAAVKSLLTFCPKIGYCRFNVGAALSVRKPKTALAERILPHEEVRRTVEPEDGPRNHAMLRLLYETGSRVSELCGMAWHDVQPRDNGLAQVTIFGRGDKTRHVLISKRLYRELVRMRGAASDDELVFPSKTGRPLDQPAMFRVMQSAAKRAGIEQSVSPHWFRHAAASHALDNGCPIGLVEDQLGHGSLEATSVDVHARPTDGVFKYLR
jgi:integrase/recombinase XerD